MTEVQAEDRKIAPRSAHLPQVSLEQVLPIARALQELAAASTAQRIAQRLRVSPSGGQFRSRVGAAGYYGLIRRQGERRALTELGERVLGTGDEAIEARRVAVLSTGFRPIFVLFRGRDVNEGAIQARLQDDMGVPAAASAQIARALIDSGQQTGLINGTRFDTEVIEVALGQSNSPATDSVTPASSAHPRRADAVATPRLSESRVASTSGASTARPSPAVHIDIQIHIPATATNEQIDQIFSSMAKHLYGRD